MQQRYHIVGLCAHLAWVTNSQDEAGERTCGVLPRAWWNSTALPAAPLARPQSGPTGLEQCQRAGGEARDARQIYQAAGGRGRTNPASVVTWDHAWVHSASGCPYSINVNLIDALIGNRRFQPLRHKAQARTRPWPTGYPILAHRDTDFRHRH